MSCYPDALTRKNKRGMLPLHRAYAGGVPDAVLQIIYNGYPLAAQVQDNKNSKFLHSGPTCVSIIFNCD